jgi:hypothetical protein
MISLLYHFAASISRKGRLLLYISALHRFNKEETDAQKSYVTGPKYH